MTKREKKFIIIGAITVGLILFVVADIWGYVQWREVIQLREELIKLKEGLVPRSDFIQFPSPTPEVTPTPIAEIGIPEHPVVAGRVTKPVAADVTWPQSKDELIVTLRQKLKPAEGKPFILAGVKSDVRWLAEPEEMTMTPEIYQLFASDDSSNDLNAYQGYGLFRVGYFVSGKYAGKEAVLFNEPGMISFVSLFAYDSMLKTAVFLPNYPFDDADENNAGGRTVDRVYRFADLDYPTTFTILPGVQLREVWSRFGGSFWFSVKEVDLIAQGTSFGDLYYDYGQNIFSVRVPTGHAVSYAVVVPILVNTSPEGSVDSGDYDLTWWYGSSTQEYIHTALSGCGSTNYLDVATTIAPEQLVQVGTTGMGDPIYEFSDLTAEPLQKQYREWYVPFEKTKLPYEEFLQLHPMFFWQDQLGRLVRFTKKDFIPGVECGKPAIYLYPPTTQRVRVEVSPRGGFTYTEPPYGQGWNVVATPDGTLTDVASGKTYNYLWWDGRGGLYAPPEKFWVVAQPDVETFLRKTLPQLGLQPNEIAEFLDYWLPYFTTDYPYYKIGFHGNLAMNELAPLTVTPQPDTVIRVLMDYEGLSAPQLSNPSRIITPRRKGFTVVEWGGVRH